MTGRRMGDVRVGPKANPGLYAFPIRVTRDGVCLGQFRPAMATVR